MGKLPPKRDDILWELLPLHAFSCSIERMDCQLDSLFGISNNTWNIFKKRDTNFIHLNVNSLLSKIDKIRYIAKLTNATVIELN